MSHDAIARTVRKFMSHRTSDVHLIDDVCQNVLVDLLAKGAYASGFTSRTA